MIREHRGSLKVEERLEGAVWVLRIKVTRESDHKRVERTRVIGRVEDFPTEAQAFAEAERRRLYTIEPGSKRGILTFAILAEFHLQELKKVSDSKKRKPKAASTVEDRERIIRKRLLPRFGEREALKIKPSEIKGWLESVQDEEDLENSTVDKIRRVMHLVYSMAQANDLIPRTVEANPVTHVHIAPTTEYEAVLVTPQQAWNIICRMQAFDLFQPRSSSTSITRCQPHCSSPTKHTGPSPTSCRPSPPLKTHSHRRPTAPRGGFVQVVVSKATAADSDEATNFSSAVASDTTLGLIITDSRAWHRQIKGLIAGRIRPAMMRWRNSRNGWRQARRASSPWKQRKTCQVYPTNCLKPRPELRNSQK